MNETRQCFVSTLIKGHIFIFLAKFVIQIINTLYETYQNNLYTIGIICLLNFFIFRL